jgi:hypothetical protein
MHVTKLLLLAPSITLLAALVPETRVYDVARYGAKCNAVTTGSIHTTLARAVAAGAGSVTMTSVENVVPGAQIYLDPLAGTQEILYVRSVAGSEATFTAPLKNEHQAGSRVYGSGGYVAGTDDTAAINAAFAAAARDGGATVQFPAGKCAISGPLNASVSGLTVAGAGMHATTIVAMPNFDYDPARTPRGFDAQYVGMLWTDLPIPPPARGLSPPQPPLQHLTIENLGLDPRAGTQSGHFYKFQPITGYVRAMQYLTVRNVYFELGSPLSPTDITKPFKGIDYTVLAYDPANSSHDFDFENIEAHNGVGTVQLRQGAGYNQHPCPTTVPDRIDRIKIVNERDDVDLNDIQDDRIVLTAKACNPGAAMDDIQITGHVVSIAPSVTNGAFNGLKLEAGNAVMHNVEYTDARYTGSPNGSYKPDGTRTAMGNPFGALIFDRGAGITNLVVAHLHAVNSEGIGAGLRGGPSGEPVTVTLDDLNLTNTYSNVCVRFAGFSAPSGHDQVHVSNVTCSAAPEARARFGDNLFGVLFLPTGGVATNGVSGDVAIRNSRFVGYARPLFIYRGGGFKGVVVDGVTWDGGRPEVDPSTIMRNTSPH